MSEPEEEVEVVDVPERSRFEIRVDGELAGFTEYRLRPDRIVFPHTEVDDRFHGRGLAARLVRFALDSSRERGPWVTPLCPYVAGYIRRHREYVPIVDDGHRAEFVTTE